MSPLGFWETVTTSQRAYSALCNVLQKKKKGHSCLGPAPGDLSETPSLWTLLSSSGCMEEMNLATPFQAAGGVAKSA